MGRTRGANCPWDGTCVRPRLTAAAADAIVNHALRLMTLFSLLYIRAPCGQALKAGRRSARGSDPKRASCRHGSHATMINATACAKQVCGLTSTTVQENSENSRMFSGSAYRRSGYHLNALRFRAFRVQRSRAAIANAAQAPTFVLMAASPRRAAASAPILPIAGPPRESSWRTGAARRASGASLRCSGDSAFACVRLPVTRSECLRDVRRLDARTGG